MITVNSTVAITDSVCQGIIEKACADYGVTVEMLTDEIFSVISDMHSGDAVKASGWYYDANAFAVQLAVKHNVSIEIAAGVISAVSPRMPWMRNKNVADAILGAFRQYSELSAIDAAKQIGLAMSNNVAMAIRIARGEDIEIALTGTKRRSFYNNIVAPMTSNDVTVDTWMIQAFCNVTGKDKKTGERFVKANEKALNGTGVGYFVIASAVRQVAHLFSIKPHQAQACYWVSVSNSYNGSRTDIA